MRRPDEVDHVAVFPVQGGYIAQANFGEERSTEDHVRVDLGSAVGLVREILLRDRKLRVARSGPTGFREGGCSRDVEKDPGIWRAAKKKDPPG